MRPKALLVALALTLLSTSTARAQDARETLEEAFKRCAAAADPAVILIASCSAAINSQQLEPDGLAVALVVRGSAYGDSERPDLGIADLDRALGIKPSLVLANSVRADLRAKLRDYRHAIEDLDVVLAAQADDVRSLRRRGEFHDWLGETAAALADFNAALALKEEVPTYVDRAIVYGDNDDKTRAFNDIEAALRLSPDDPFATYERGLLRYRTGEFADAASDLAKAADAKADDAYYTIWAYLGAARSGAADAKEALQNRAQRLDLGDWPGQVIELYLGRRQPGDVSPPKGGHIPWMTDGYRCEAEFYLGEYDVLQGDNKAARPHLEAAIATGIAEFVEHRGAKDELARLPP
jgi:lipoprotein NlpI